MASPEQNRVGGARPSGAGGVRNLLAMFEKSSSSPGGSPAPSGGSHPTSSASLDQSPGPKPLARVRTSFVAVQGNGLGLQKAQIPPSPLSPVISGPDGSKLFGGPLETEKSSVDKKEEAGLVNRSSQPLDEANLKKHDLETQNGYTTPKPSVHATRSSPPLENTPVKQEESAPEKPSEPILTEKHVSEPAKPTKVEGKPKSTGKAAPAPKSPTKPTFPTNKTNKAAPTTRPGKNLTLPPSKGTTTSPLPSPALPRSPARSAASASSSTPRAKPTEATQPTHSAPTKTRTTASSSTATSQPASKPRQPTTAVEKTKAPAKKGEAKPPRESSKPPTIRSSAFAPTAASAAKLAADQQAAAARTRPPSSASHRNRSPPTSTGMRRGNSGLGARPGRKDQRSPQRPQTSAAIRNPNRTSVGSVAGVAGAGGGGDFLSRMMRPTTASAGKVSDKKPGPMNPPQKRSASVANTSRRREKSSPPSTGRIPKQTTGEKAKEEANATAEPVQQSSETSDVNNQIPEVAQPNEEIVEVKKSPEARPAISVETEIQESEDDSQSPTTTTSSTTLVHEGEGKDDTEVLAKEQVEITA